VPIGGHILGATGHNVVVRLLFLRFFIGGLEEPVDGDPRKCILSTSLVFY